MLENITISEFLKEEFDVILDARDPRNFEISHIPKAINFYALNNLEFAKTGLIYKKNKFSAKFYGAGAVCKNIAEQLKKLENLPSGAKIGIYCSRGGMRSNAIACVLDMIGFRVYRLIDGYKAYRAYVLNEFKNELDIKFITLFSNTGCAKTKILKELKLKGYPVIDIEDIANHFGSIFGGKFKFQPSQKMFENMLFNEIYKFKNKLVFIEGESARLGKLIVPKSLNSSLHNPYIAIFLNSSIEFRIKNILSDYASIDKNYFFECIEKISPFIKKEFKLEAIKEFNNKNYESVVKNLLLNYYDIVYKKPKKIDIFLENKDIKSCVLELENIYNSHL